MAKYCGRLVSLALLGKLWSPAGIPSRLRHTPSRLRPLALRRRMIALPPLVRLRTKKPWLRRRLVLDGWKVRLDMIHLFRFSKKTCQGRLAEEQSPALYCKSQRHHRGAP